VNIKSQKDFFSGLMFMCVGVAFAWGASSYNIGNGARMGPGYFPLVLGVLLSVLGGVITFKALVVETVDGEKIGTIAWRPLFFIIAANLVFGASIGGLPSIGMRPLGLIFGIFAKNKAHWRPPQHWHASLGPYFWYLCIDVYC
jgi:hypothetical protein